MIFSCSKDSVEEIKKFVVEVRSTEGGTVSSNGGEFISGSSFSVTAIPLEGYTFSGWSNGSSSNPLQLTITSNQTIEANFVELVNQFNISIFSQEGGSVSSTGGAVNEGTNVTITATPNQGYRFIGWEGYQSEEQTITVTVNENITITALFEELEQYNVNFISQQGGIVTNNGGLFYNGHSLNIQAVANEGYVFSGWSNEDYTSSNINYTVSENTTITAYFNALAFDSSTMDVIKYGAYSKDTISGKSVVDLNEFHFPYLNWNFNGINVEESLDYIASENFIVYWDKRYDRREYAIDILRWSEFSAEKALESGCRKPQDYDTHRINIFIFQNDEYGIDVFEPDFGQAVHGDSNGRAWVSYPFYNNFNEINRAFPTMDVLHETYHVFQVSDNYLFDQRRWYRESTAEYFQSIYVADERINTLRHTGHYLQSTNLRVWKGYGTTTGELQHLYGLQLLFHYLEWEGHINNSYIGNSWNDSNTGETPLQYLVRTIPNFKNLYFDFSLKSTVIDYPYWTDLIQQSLTDLDNSDYWVTGERHFLQTSGGNISNYEKNDVEAWGFASIKVNSSSVSRNISLEFNSDYNYRIGVVREVNSNYSYEEISSTETINALANQTIYIVFVNDENIYSGNNSYPFEFNLTFD